MDDISWKKIRCETERLFSPPFLCRWIIACALRLASRKVIMEMYGALFNNTFFLCTNHRVSNNNPRTAGRKFKHAKRYTNAITKKTCNISFAQHSLFFSLQFSRNEWKLRERLISFTNQLFMKEIFFLSEKNYLLCFTKNCRVILFFLVLFFCRDKRGLYPSESPRRFRDSRTRRYPFMYTCTYVRVISLSFRNIRWRGKVVEDETYLAGSVNSPSCLPQLRARRMCFQHTIVNTFYFFVYKELLLSVYRWNRAAPDPLSIGHSSRWRDSEGL